MPVSSLKLLENEGEKELKTERRDGGGRCESARDKSGTDSFQSGGWFLHAHTESAQALLADKAGWG